MVMNVLDHDGICGHRQIVFHISVCHKFKQN